MTGLVDIDGGLEPAGGAYAGDSSRGEAFAEPQRPGWTVEVATTSPLVDPPTWVDITAAALSFRTIRGRDDELDDDAPGSATVVLDDPARDFDPDNSSATHGALMTPGRRIRIRAAGHPLFDGYLDDPIHTYGRGRETTVELPLYDLATTIAADSVTTLAHLSGAGETTGARIGRVLDVIGVPAALRDIDTGRSNLPAFIQQNTAALAYISRIARTEFGRAFVSRDGRFTFRERYQTAPPVLLELHDDGTGDGPPTQIQTSSGRSRLVTVAEVDWFDRVDSIADVAAVAAYGRQRKTFTVLLANELDAYAYGEQALVMRSTPRRHIRRINLNEITDPALLDTLLSLELGSRVTVRRTMDIGDVLNFDCTVERISWRATDVSVGCELRLAPSNFFDQWTAGDTAGSAKKLGY